MTRVTVSTVIDAAPSEVWDVVENVSDHASWMHDAESITITSDHDRGVGTTMSVATKVGPFRMTDLMEITEWEDSAVMGVRHVGVVTGTGRFTLDEVSTGTESPRTEFCWDEELVFPWWMGGPIGGRIGGKLLEAIWRRNLADLKKIIEGP